MSLEQVELNKGDCAPEFFSHFGTGALLMWPTKAHAYGSQKQMEKYSAETKDRAGQCTMCHSSTLCTLSGFFILLFCLHFCSARSICLS